ncbi:MAG: DNA repair protein RAD16, partial [Paramarteilia canceri]
HEDCNEENLYFDIYKEEAKYKEYESKYSIKHDVKSLSKKTKEYSESFYLPNMVNSKLYPVYSPIHDKFQINESLEELQPSFIIIFDPIMQTIRQVERYCSAFCSEEYQVEVSLLFYEKGIDRIAYFCDIQRENEAFEYLIKEKA